MPRRHVPSSERRRKQNDESQPDSVTHSAIPVWNQDVKLHENGEGGKADRFSRYTDSEGWMIT